MSKFKCLPVITFFLSDSGFGWIRISRFKQIFLKVTGVHLQVIFTISVLLTKLIGCVKKKKDSSRLRFYNLNLRNAKRLTLIGLPFNNISHFNLFCPFFFPLRFPDSL